MENAVKALEMAFAAMVFIIALSVSIFAFNSAKSASDTMLYVKDETNYYEYKEVVGKEFENRIVGIETIIPTLYKYYKEDFSVVFRIGNYHDGIISNAKPLPVYYTPSNLSLWSTNYSENIKSKYQNIVSEADIKEKEIFSFDADEEQARREPWTGSYVQYRKNLDCFVKGDCYYNPNVIRTPTTKEYLNYSKSPLETGGFMGKYGNKQFVETIAEYTYQSNTDDEDASSSIPKKEKKKRMIIYTLIN